MTSYSDEILNAFVDGELEGHEKEKFKLDMQNDEQLKNHVHALCNLKKSIQSGYAQVPLPKQVDETKSSTSLLDIKLVMLVVLVLCAGFFLGSVVSHKQTKADYATHEKEKLDKINGVKLTTVDLQQPNKIILHVSSSSADVLYNTLHKVDVILDKYKKNKIPFELEVIANSGGIDLLREDVSPYKERIKEIMKDYNNVSFIACTNAIEKLQMKGIKPDLIAETKIGKTAIEQIIKRLQEGWVYVKV